MREKPSEGAVTRRSVALALALVPLLCVLTQVGDVRVAATPMAGAFPPLGPSYYGLGAVGIGAALTLLLGALRFRLAWWPLHPLGYVLSGTVQQALYPAVWFSIVLGWLCKVLLLRYGGAKVMRRAYPFFLGLIVGDLCAAGLWTLIDGLTGHTGLSIWPQ